MPVDTLEAMCTELIAQNAPKLGRALAEMMLASLTGRDFATTTAVLHRTSRVEHRDTAAPPSTAASTQKARSARQFDKRPGSAKQNNEKILAAIAEKGSTLQEIVDKAKLPKKYVRSRINRLIRDDETVRSEGKTTKTRYFRV
jgi:hypothetical protein